MARPTLDPLPAPTPPAEPAPSLPASPPFQPFWVQNHAPTTLTSGPDEHAVSFGEIGPWHYLQVVQPPRGGRLLVLVPWSNNYAWIDAAAVGPSGPPPAFQPFWVQNHAETTLWSGPDEQAVAFGPVRAWNYFQVVEPQRGGRLHVLVARTRNYAWIDASAVGPSGPPPAPDLPAEPEQRAFIELVAPLAQANQRATGVPAAVTIAMAIHESEWRRSQLATQANNLFGIKATAGGGSAGTITLPTWEVYGGRSVVVSEPFRAYASVADSIADFGRFLRDNDRYAAAFQYADDPRAFVRAIAAAGYATDPAYADKVVGYIDRFRLDRFDFGG